MSRVYTDIQDEHPAKLLRKAYEHAYEQGWTDGLPVVPPIA